MNTSIKYAGLFFSCAWLMIISLAFSATAAHSNDAFSGNSGQKSGGSSDFILKDGAGNTIQALTLSAKVDMEINGLVNHTHLQQRFYNSSHEFVSGEYVFPLPDTASVDSLTIKIGSRIIKGEIKEKAQAKKIFEQAQKQGKKAALLTQNRPNLFRMAVTNIPPGEIIEISMSYVNAVEFDQGEYRVMFPMTLTPRYNSSIAINGEPGRENLNSENLSDNSFQNPSFMLNHPAGADIKNPVELSIHFTPGFKASNVISSSHDIIVNDVDEQSQRIAFSQRFVPMDSDFHLSWKQNNKALQPQLFVETVHSEIDEEGIESIEDEHFAMLMLTPGAEIFDQAVLNKEVIFIIDTSGSMGGDSIKQAKAALLSAVELLNDGDSFNVIEFNSDFTTLFNQSLNFNSNTKRKAKDFIEALQANGGTEMKPALLQALRSPVDKEERLKQVVFITDGAVGNEQDLIRTINQYLGGSRLFSIAIGSAPNQHLFRQVSKVGKGTFVQISEMNQVSSKMKSVFEKISKPAMKNLELVDKKGTVLAIAPESIPDVYFGEPIKVMLKLSTPDSDLILRGTQAGQQFEQALTIRSTSSRGIAKLWGKAKIEALTDKMTLGQGDTVILKQEIIELSMKHTILTPFTSFIAVDKVVSRKPGQALKHANVKNLVPKGSQSSKATQFPSTSLDIQPLYTLSLLLMCLGLFLGYRRKVS